MSNRQAPSGSVAVLVINRLHQVWGCIRLSFCSTKPSLLGGIMAFQLDSDVKTPSRPRPLGRKHSFWRCFSKVFQKSNAHALQFAKEPGSCIVETLIQRATTSPGYSCMKAECVKHFGISAYLHPSESLDGFRYLRLISLDLARHSATCTSLSALY